MSKKISDGGIDSHPGRGNEGISQYTRAQLEEEVRNSVRRFIRLHGSLTKTDQLLLLNTYVKKERLSQSQLEKIIDEETKANKANNKQEKTNSFQINLRNVATMTGLMVIAIMGLYFNSDPNIKVSEREKRPVEMRIKGSISSDTTWYAETKYYLNGPVFIEGKTRLTIQPGTQIFGEFESTLVVTREAEIYARGQNDKSIIFTSAKPVGTRQRGDWGGIILLGNAPTNRLEANIEGIDENDPRGRFGGQREDNSCGVLEYVRIEFAGFEVFADNELNGLTMGGCGHNTIARYIHVHRAADDGIEMFGGTADLKHILITGAKDDSLDWDMGWRGRVQFMVIQQYNDAGDNGFEADN